MLTVIQIVGQARTGTNYLQWLLRRNFRDLILVIFGKHDPRDWRVQALEGGKREARHKVDYHANTMMEIRTETDCAAARVQASDICSIPTQGMDDGLIRIKATPEAADAIEAAILSTTLKYVINFRHPASSYLSRCRAFSYIRFQTQKWLDGFNNWVQGWTSFADAHPDRCAIVRFESLLAQPEQQLDIIGHTFGISREPEFQVPHLVVDLRCRELKGKIFQRGYYERQDFYDDLSKNELDLMENGVNRAWMKRFQYEWRKR
jgi:hypothetical protein